MTNVVIVGADRGIGAAMANVYHRRGDTVVAVCFGGGTESDLYVATADNTEAPELRGCVFRSRAPCPGLAAPPARI